MYTAINCYYQVTINECIHIKQVIHNHIIPLLNENNIVYDYQLHYHLRNHIHIIPISKLTNIKCNLHQLHNVC